MKLKFLFSLLLAGSLTASAQGYKDGVEYFKADQFANAKTLLERNLGTATSPADKALAYYYLGAIMCMTKIMPPPSRTLRKAWPQTLQALLTRWALESLLL